MRPPDDTVLLTDMLDYAQRAVTALEGRSREVLDTDAVLVAAPEIQLTADRRAAYMPPLQND